MGHSFVGMIEFSGMKTVFMAAFGFLVICYATLSDGYSGGLEPRFADLEKPRDFPGEFRRLIPHGFLGFDELVREDRGLIKEPRPLCKEIRTELSSSMYIPELEDAEGYTLRPHKIYMVNCSREADGWETGSFSDGVCWPQQCREKYVDIDIFGKPKTVKENLWQLMTEITSVPIACECFKMI